MEVSLDNGITEFDFWQMTIGEIERAVASKKRLAKRKAQEKASFDYALAELIGRSVGRLYSSSNKYPDISEVYPTLFDGKEIKEKQQKEKAELSAIRFKQFADSFNQKFKKGGKKCE